MSVPCKDFPWFPTEPPPMLYRFCENYEALLQHFGVEVPQTSDRVRRFWHLPLRLAEEQLILKVYEETVHLSSPNCEQCRCNGWQHHPVSSKKVHFILPSPLGMDLPEDQLFDSKLHVLHGVVHLNGFGHLLRINGLEGGSQFLRGKQVMQLWDKLCQYLRVRDVSVEDVSSKKGMLLRVLLPVLSKTTFYMQHGYNFGRGQFNVCEPTWSEAVEKLHQTSLLDLFIDFDGVDETVQKIILSYGLSKEGELQTLGVMLQRMLHLAEDEKAALEFGLAQLAQPNDDRLAALMKQIEEEIVTQQPNGVCSLEETEEEPVSGSPNTTAAATESCPIVDASATPISRSTDASLFHPESDHETEQSRTIDLPFDEDCSVKVSRKSKKRIPVDDPGDLVRPKILPFNAASLFEGSRRYSATKMVEIIRITLGVLQKYENRWVRLQELRDILYETAHDRVLADFVLGRMANTIVNGYSVIKQRSKAARCNYYLFEKHQDGDRDGIEEAFLDHVDEPAPPAPGPEEVNGQSLERFEQYLALLFKWMCQQPHVSVGRGPNKNKPKPKRKEPETERFGFVSGAMRLTRAAVSNASKRSKLDSPRPITQPWLEVYPSEVAPHLELLRNRGPEAGIQLPYRKGVLVDLLYIYQSVLEVYKPLIDGRKASLRLADLPKRVQALKDAKFFVKRFQTEPPTPLLIERNGTPGFIRLVCRVILDTTVPPGLENSRLKDQQPDFFREPPPAEEVYVSVGSSMVEVKHAVEEAFSKIYSIFDVWNVSTLSNFERETAVLDAPCDMIIEVRGLSIRPELELRHSGGIEDWEVLCNCGTRDDDGARMLCCDSCSVWMHTRCVGFRDDMNVPSFFQCSYCRRG